MKRENTDIIGYRKYFFIALYQTIVYFPLAIILVGKRATFNLSFLSIFVFLIFLLIIPIGLAIYRIKKKNIDLKQYKFLLLIANIPLILGFLITVIQGNYLYIMVSFLITIVSIFILTPIKKLKAN